MNASPNRATVLSVPQDTPNLVEIRQSETFGSWRRDLRDRRARARIQVRIDRLSLGHAGDVRPVGHGVSEPEHHLIRWTRQPVTRCPTLEPK